MAQALNKSLTDRIFNLNKYTNKLMSPNIKKLQLIGGMMFIMLPVTMNAQEITREATLMEDIERLGERAVRDNVISNEERQEILGFARDSLPESTDLKVRALEQIRDELDEQYAEMVRNALQKLDEAGYIGRDMIPDRLYEPEDYVSAEEKRLENEAKAMASIAANMEEILKYVKPLPMKPWLRTTLRLLFGRGVNHRPERWDYTVVPQMGGVYDIIMPGGKPDDSWRDMPEMVYDPHLDRHFRR